MAIPAALTRSSPAEYDAMTSSTIDVVESNRLVLGRDVLKHFYRQDPVVARQPVLWQRQVQELHLRSTTYVCMNDEMWRNFTLIKITATPPPSQVGRR